MLYPPRSISLSGFHGPFRTRTSKSCGALDDTLENLALDQCTCLTNRFFRLLRFSTLSNFRYTWNEAHFTDKHLRGTIYCFCVTTFTCRKSKLNVPMYVLRSMKTPYQNLPVELEEMLVDRMEQLHTCR